MTFDACRHGDASPIPKEFEPALAHIAWLSSLLIADDLGAFERAVVRFERALAERTARRALQRRKRNA